MKEYIERAALIVLLKADMEFCDKELGDIPFSKGAQTGLNAGINYATVLPAADVVEVVRCKDCIHWLNEDGIEDHVCLKIYDDAGVHSVAWQNRNPDDFCSYGERR